MPSDIEIVMIPRAGVGELVEACARGELPFSGPDSLHSRIHAMGYKTTGLYEAVIAAEAALTRSTSIMTGE